MLDSTYNTGIVFDLKAALMCLERYITVLRKFSPTPGTTVNENDRLRFPWLRPDDGLQFQAASLMLSAFIF